MSRRLLRILVCGLTLICCGAVFAQTKVVALQAHRGGRGLLPENTLAAFQSAINMGVSAVELDVVATKDEVLIVSHEPALNPDITRGPDGNFISAPGTPFIQLTRAEVEAYDVGKLNPSSNYARNFRDQKSVDGQRIPRLQDVLNLVKASGNTKVRLEIEIKGSPLQPQLTPDPVRLAEKVVQEVVDSGLAARVDILSFDWRTLQAVQRMSPSTQTVYLTAQLRELDNLTINSGQGSPWTAGFQYKQYGSVPKMIKAAGGAQWSSFWRELDAQKVRDAHDQGLKVLAWTVNDREAFNKMLDMGVDGIVTDRPDIAMEVFRARSVSW
jgi:glycerophosphoryl diester phosphodiesterase